MRDPSSTLLLVFFPRARLTPPMDVLSECIRHACLLRAISMGGLDDERRLGSKRSGRSMPISRPSRLHRGARTVTTATAMTMAMLPSALRRRLFASVTLSPIDSWYSDREVRHSALHESRARFYIPPLPFCRNRDNCYTCFLYYLSKGKFCRAFLSRVTIKRSMYVLLYDSTRF